MQSSNPEKCHPIYEKNCVIISRAAHAVCGVATDSLDADGAILERSPMDFDEAELRTVIERFTGTIAQIPPMVSARKIGGRKLYELAREGKEVDREARDVEIYSLDLIEFAPQMYPEVTFRTVCSTGTYVRTLADDMAQALGGRAHLVALRRVRNGSLLVADALTIDQVEEAVADETIIERMLTPTAVAMAIEMSLISPMMSRIPWISAFWTLPVG